MSLNLPKSEWVTPFVLVLWGGVVPGQRARTKLAYIESFGPEDASNPESRKVFRGRVFVAPDRLAMRSRIFGINQIVKFWADYPTKTQIKVEREKMPIAKQIPKGTEENEH